MTRHRIATAGEWQAARLELLAREKAFTRERDALSAARRELPWLRVENDYRFATVDGEKSLDDLFAGCSQLLVYHFMFGPEWDEGCPSCSFWADGYDGLHAHLAARDITLVTIARAPLEKLQAYRRRMGWRFDFVSSHGSDFNIDFGVSFTEAQRASGEANYNFGTSVFSHDEAPGTSCFTRDEDGIYLTYATFSRGLDMLNAAYHLMDLTAKGRDEDAFDYPMAWLRRHDRY